MEEISSSEVKDAVENVIGEEAADAAADVAKSFLETMENPLIRAAVTMIVCIIVAKIVLSLTNKAVKKMKLEPTANKFVGSLIHVVVYAVAVLVIAGTLGVDVTSLVAIFSVVGAAFALAAQNTLANFFGGILLLVSKPLLAGEYVVTTGGEGVVQEVGLLHTNFLMPDNRVVVVPNNTIVSGVIVNCSRGGTRRVDLNFSISYDADMESVKRVIVEVMEANPMVLREPEPPFARVTAFGESAVTYTARFWCKGSDFWPVQYDLLEQTKMALDKAGIEIPYNHLNVHMIGQK